MLRRWFVAGGWSRLGKRDFRTVANARLESERNSTLSQNVLRLLGPEPKGLPPHVERAKTTIEPHPRTSKNDVVEKAAPVPTVELAAEATTGLLSADVWRELLAHEEGRLARHGRPITVVVAELEGLSSLAAWFGEDVAERLVTRLATALRRNARQTYVLARTEGNRFEALLPDTHETEATDSVERARRRCDMLLEAGALAVRVAVGWAQPAIGGRLGDALRTAEQRMIADRSQHVPALGPIATSDPWSTRGTGD